MNKKFNNFVPSVEWEPVNIAINANIETPPKKRRRNPKNLYLYQAAQKIKHATTGATINQSKIITCFPQCFLFTHNILSLSSCKYQLSHKIAVN
jgi:hypothetical protein